MTSMFILYSINKQVFIEDLYQAMNYSQHVRGVIEQNRLKAPNLCRFRSSI